MAELRGSPGNDTLTGGAGNDRLSYEGSDAGVSVNLATGVVSSGHAASDPWPMPTPRSPASRATSSRSRARHTPTPSPAAVDGPRHSGGRASPHSARRRRPLPRLDDPRRPHGAGRADLI